MQQTKSFKAKCIFKYFRLLRPIEAAIATILFSTYSFAETVESCPPLPILQTEPSPDEWIVLRQELGSKVTFCLQDSAFFALYGASLLHSGLISQAIENLERALLLDPMNGSAMIDYSSALHSSGDLIIAIQLNNQLLMREDLPKNIHNYLSERGEEWKKSTVNWSNKLSILRGYNNNLNSTADLKELTLTLSNQDIVIELDEDSQPIKGHYDSFAVSTKRISLLEDGFSRLSFNVASRSSDLSRVDTDSLGFSYEREHTLEDGSYIWDLGSLYVFYGGKGLYSSISGSITRYWRNDLCSPYFSGEEKLMYFPNQVQYNEMSTSLSWGTLCGLNHGLIDASFSFNRNTSLNNRPGENRFTKELSLKWQKEVGKATLSSEISYSSTKDEEGYNTLLNNNAKRYTKTTNATLRFLYPINKHTSLQSGLYYQSQKSNLALFNTNGMSADLGIQLKF